VGHPPDGYPLAPRRVVEIGNGLGGAILIVMADPRIKE
jgi:hypothetical protein